MKRIAAVLALFLLVLPGCSEDGTGPSDGPGIVTLTGQIEDPDTGAHTAIRIRVEYDAILDESASATVHSIYTTPARVSGATTNVFIKALEAALDGEPVYITYSVEADGGYAVAGYLIWSSAGGGETYHLNWSGPYKPRRQSRGDLEVEDVSGADAFAYVEHRMGGERQEYYSGYVALEVRATSRVADTRIMVGPGYSAARDWR